MDDNQKRYEKDRERLFKALADHGLFPLLVKETVLSEDLCKYILMRLVDSKNATGYMVEFASEILDKNRQHNITDWFVVKFLARHRKVSPSTLCGLAGMRNISWDMYSVVVDRILAQLQGDNYKGCNYNR